MILWQMFSFSKKLGLNSVSSEVQDRRKMYLTLGIALIQALALTTNLPVQAPYNPFLVFLLNTSLLVAGTFFLVWLSDINASIGVGGPIVILLASMVASLPQDIIQSVQVHKISPRLLSYGSAGVLFTYLVVLFSELDTASLSIKSGFILALNAIPIWNHAQSCRWHALYVCDESHGLAFLSLDLASTSG